MSFFTSIPYTKNSKLHTTLVAVFEISVRQKRGNRECRPAGPHGHGVRVYCRLPPVEQAKRVEYADDGEQDTGN